MIQTPYFRVSCLQGYMWGKRWKFIALILYALSCWTLKASTDIPEDLLNLLFSYLYCDGGYLHQSVPMRLPYEISSISESGSGTVSAVARCDTRSGYRKFIRFVRGRCEDLLDMVMDIPQYVRDLLFLEDTAVYTREEAPNVFYFCFGVESENPTTIEVHGPSYDYLYYRERNLYLIVNDDIDGTYEIFKLVQRRSDGSTVYAWQAIARGDYNIRDFDILSPAPWMGVRGLQTILLPRDEFDFLYSENLYYDIDGDEVTVIYNEGWIITTARFVPEAIGMCCGAAVDSRSTHIHFVFVYDLVRRQLVVRHNIWGTSLSLALRETGIFIIAGHQDYENSICLSYNISTS